MDVSILKATISDAELIHAMQIASFAELLKKYQDYELSPGAEKIERILQRLHQDFTDYYIIVYNKKNVGAIRVVRLDKDEKCRVSPIFILPEYRNRGIAKKVFELIENKYSPPNGWILDTILEEQGNCYLYEKIGYTKTGRIDVIKDGMHIVHYEKL